ncbi:MAG: helix-turn-helix domain-containing protein [Deltaproteobacteria bacterium]|nr:helix-turn-helix domain-containing protein [Deltaproteobacteria bacterium]
MFEQHLQNLGLSQKEALIYLASLELGPITVQEISRKTGITRTTIYNLIRALEEKGLVDELRKNKRRLFVSRNPEKLLTHLQVQQKELEGKEKALQRILPQLKGLVDLSLGRPKIRFFEGKEGIRLMREDMQSSKNLACIEEFIPMDEAYQIFPPHKRDHRHRMLRALNHTYRKVIYATKKGIVLPAKERLVERRPVAREKFSLSSEINVYGDKLGIVTFGKKPMGMIIEAKEIAESLRSIFYIVWKEAKAD